MANDPTVISHPDTIDDVLEVPQPGTSDAAKSDPKKKDTTYKKNTTSPDELISLDELYSTTGQETLEIVMDGYHELKHHQRLSRAHGDAANLNTEKWIEFSDKSNGLRYGNAFIKQLTLVSAQTFTNGERFTRVLLKRSQERGKTVCGMMQRISTKLVPTLKAESVPGATLTVPQGGTGLTPTATNNPAAKLTVYIRQGEHTQLGVSRLCQTLTDYPRFQQQIADWASQVDAALSMIRQAADREALFQALCHFNAQGNIPEGIANLCSTFCGDSPATITSARQMYVMTEKDMCFRDAPLLGDQTALLNAMDTVLGQWFDQGSLSPPEHTSLLLSKMAKSLLDTAVPPPSSLSDTELLFTMMEAQRTCVRLSMILDMTQGLLQSLLAALFTALRARTTLLASLPVEATTPETVETPVTDPVVTVPATEAIEPVVTVPATEVIDTEQPAAEVVTLPPVTVTVAETVETAIVEEVPYAN